MTRPTSLIPRTLTSRLVVTAVALVALVSILVAVITTLVMRGYLTSRLDQQVHDALTRGLDSGGRLPPHEPDNTADYPRGPQQLGTLYYVLSGNRTGGGVLSRDGDIDDLSRSSVRQLTALPLDGGAHTVVIDEGHKYRVELARSSDGSLVALGLPMEEIQHSTDNLLRFSLLLALSGVVVAGAVGSVVVRRQLRPLREVAATAYDVIAMPLDSAGQSIETRVPERYTDPQTEVGRVGSALNTLLDHVDSALDARHRSEQQVRQFVADASHELRTPLSTIHGYAELSRRTPDDADALTLAMGKVETEATRMSSLVNDMLLLARLDSGRALEREEVDITRLLLEAVADAKVVAPGHRWRLALPEEPITVTGDELRLHQVVTNLINNAWRHTPAGTTVTVGAKAGMTAGDNIEITVHDNGPGIPDGVREHVFERFTRGDSSRTRASGGAGLGLALVHAVAVAHGGSASMESVPGSTTFVLSLP